MELRYLSLKHLQNRFHHSAGFKAFQSNVGIKLKMLTVACMHKLSSGPEWSPCLLEMRPITRVMPQHV